MNFFTITQAGGLLATMNSAFKEIVAKMDELVSSFWWLFLMMGVLLIVIWGGIIGVKYIVAQKNEQKLEARETVKNLIVGILIIIVVAVGGPLLIKGLAAFAGTDLDESSIKHEDVALTDRPATLAFGENEEMRFVDSSAGEIICSFKI